jgi:hypothetical protein
MLSTVAGLLSPILNFPYVLRVRRNHGLEHATIHVLNRQRYLLSGRAGGSGFVVVGDVPTEKVTKAVQEALRRFRAGESALAVHPNCGTNLVTSGIVMTTIGALGFTGTNRRNAWERFPIVLVAMIGAVLYSLPLGMVIQKHFTTSGEMGDLELVAVTRREIRNPFGRKVIIHTVTTR